MPDTQTTTVTNTLSPQMADWFNYLGGYRDLIGTGGLTPQIPWNMPLTAQMSPLVGNAANFLGSYMDSPYAQMGLGGMMNGALAMQNGNVPGNPLSMMSNPLGGDINSVLANFMRNVTFQNPTQGPQEYTGPTNNMGVNGRSGGFGNWSSGPAGGYNPMTNSDIQGQIDAVSDDLTRAFQRNELSNIRRSSIAEGGLGGSRQGIREGVAEEGLGRAILTESSRLRNQMDNAERDRQMQLALANVSAGAQAGSSGTQLAIAQMNADLDRQRYQNSNAMAAAQMAGGFMGQGYGFGLDALGRGTSMLGNALQMPLSMMQPNINLGWDMTNYAQGGIDRDLNRYLQNSGTLRDDLGFFGNMMSPLASFGTQTSTAPRQGSNSAQNIGLGLQLLSVLPGIFSMFGGGSGGGGGGNSSYGPLAGGYGYPSSGGGGGSWGTPPYW